MSDNEKTLALLAALVGVRASGPRKVQRPRMADEIRRLRDDNAALRVEIDRLTRILAALREPSEGVVNALAKVAWDEDCAMISAQGGGSMLHAAVAAAEQEVGRE